MALINCPECNREISSEAGICPVCSNTIRVKRRGFVGQVLEALFIGFNLFFLLSAVIVVWGVVVTFSSSDTNTQILAAIFGANGLGAMMQFWAATDIVLGLPLLIYRPE